MAKKSAQIRKMSTGQIERELDRRRRRLPALQQRRERILEQLRQVEDELEDLGEFGASATAARPAGRPKKAASKKAGRRKRPSNKMSLTEAMVKVMRGRKNPIGIGELAEAVHKAGYTSNASNFQQIVAQTLSRDRRFKNVSRGKYLLAG